MSQKLPVNGFEWVEDISTKYNSRYLTRLSFRTSFISYIYIYDLPYEITCKIIAYDISIFSKIESKSCSNFQLNKDLKTISKWAFQLKILFNPDRVKQAIEFCLTHKYYKEVYPSLKLNINDTLSAGSQKYLEIVLDSKL